MVTLLLSAIALAALFTAGVADADLLVVVFTPSVVVGIVVAVIARRAAPRKSWLVGSGRMP